MRRVLTAVACVLLLALCIWLMELVEPVDAPPAATPTPTQTPTPTPGVLVIHPPEGWDGDWEDLYVAIPVEGMPE